MNSVQIITAKENSHIRLAGCKPKFTLLARHAPTLPTYRVEKVFGGSDLMTLSAIS